MRWPELPAPRPTAITEISPSVANQLLACPRKVAFGRDPELRGWRKPSTHAVLGLVAHAVTEAPYGRTDWPTDPDLLRRRVEELWESEVQKAVDSLNKAWAPATPPPPSEWPGYQLTRSRTIRRVMRSVAEDGRSIAAPSVSHRVEVSLRDPKTGLMGRADRIEDDGESIRVVDLKTGLRQEEPTDDQRRQLLLYGVLVHRERGRWPTSLAIEDAAGHKFTFPLDPGEAEEALTQVIEAVASFNDTADQAGVANPSAHHCGWCPYRVVCQPFWSTLTSDWGVRAALGRIAERGLADKGHFAKLEIASPRDRAGQELHLSGLNTPPPADASWLAVSDWVGPPDAAHARASWSTLVYAW